MVERSPQLAVAFRSFRDSKHLSRQPVRTPMGFQFIGHDGMERGTFEPDEVALLTRLLDGCDLFVNVGANMGYYCCLALQKGKDVVAYEPIPANLQLLYRNLRANGGETRARVHPIAVGDRAGLVDIYGGGTAASLLQGWAGIPASYRQTVPLDTLNDTLGQSIEGKRCLVLIDVEGAELGVLRGASRLLDANPRTAWVIEINIDEHQPDGRRINPNLVATFDEFERRGYGVWLVGASLRKLGYDEVRAIASTGKNTLTNHNFLFADPASLAGG